MTRKSQDDRSEKVFPNKSAGCMKCRGFLLLEGVARKNMATCFKDPKFIDFFFKRLQVNIFCDTLFIYYFVP